MALVSDAFVCNLARELLQRNGALPVMWRALAVTLVLTAPFVTPPLANPRWTGRTVGSLVALGALGMGVAYAMLATAAGRMDATRASANNFIIPVVSLLLGITIRHEQVSRIAIVGAGVCLTGAWLIRPCRWTPRNRETGGHSPFVEHMHESNRRHHFDHRERFASRIV